jgi:hypothetical protein
VGEITQLLQLRNFTHFYIKIMLKC